MKTRPEVHAAVQHARAVLDFCNVGEDQDFFTLSSRQVDALLMYARRDKYRKPRNANGSRARYYLARLHRMIARGNS